MRGAGNRSNFQPRVPALPSLLGERPEARCLPEPSPAQPWERAARFSLALSTLKTQLPAETSCKSAYLGEARGRINLIKRKKRGEKRKKKKKKFSLKKSNRKSKRKLTETTKSPSPKPFLRGAGGGNLLSVYPNQKQNQAGLRITVLVAGSCNETRRLRVAAENLNHVLFSSRQHRGTRREKGSDCLHPLSDLGARKGISLQ